MYIAAMHFPFDLQCRLRMWHLQFLSFIALASLVLCAPAQQMPAGHDMGDMLPVTPPEPKPSRQWRKRSLRRFATTIPTVP